MRIVSFIQLLFSSATVASGAAATSLAAQATSGTGTTWAAVEDALGRKGAVQPGDVMRFSFPRSDLTVSIAGVTIQPALALSGWLAFRETGKAQTLVMGDLVLTEGEVGPVISALQEVGVQQTALHNHLLHESPRVVYMHIAGLGDAAAMARGIHQALTQTKTPLDAPAPSAPSAASLDTAGIARELGFTGRLNGVVYQVSVPRAEKIKDAGFELPPAMGVATALNFQPTEAGKAVATGDFVLRPEEVSTVLRTLREHGIEVTAVHSHMVSEEPRLIFMHFWGNDDAVTLAKGLRAALDQTRFKKG